MSPAATVLIHPSQFPENVRRDLLDSLRSRRINPKFHYDSFKQTHKWLALHQACSPSRNDPDCTGIYEKSFHAGMARIESKHIHVLGLGCGGGQKDSRLLKRLKTAGVAKLSYTPCDVSVPMTLVARRAALEAAGETECFPLVCDLQSAENLQEILAIHAPQAARIITFFGMIPNFEPEAILARLAQLVQPGDLLLFSANLSPGADYEAGCRKVLLQYDNPLTRDWLMTFLLDLGMEREDGEMHFDVETGQRSAKRVTARFHFVRQRSIVLDEEVFEFKRAESLQLFYSYRYTPGLLRDLLNQFGFAVLEQWIAASEQEGVFLCCRNNAL
jgi:L-histidine Nalpha-methyltransferase